MRRLVAALTLAAIVAVAATATAIGASKHSSAAPPKLTVGFLNILGASPAANYNQAQFLRAAKILGWKVNVVDAQGDPAKMAAGIQSFVTQKVNAIVTIAVAPAAAQQALTAAKKAGIPAISIAGANPDPNHLYAAEIQPNDSELGAITGQYMCDTLPKGAHVVAQVFPPLEALVRRDNVAEAIFKQCGIKVVATHQVDFSNVAVDSVKSTTDMLRAHPEAVGVYADQDFEFPAALQAIRSLGKTGKIKVFGFLSDPQNLSLLRKGGSAASIADADYTPPGWIAADQLLQFLGPKHTPIDPQATWNVMQMKETLLTPANVPAGDSLKYYDPAQFFVPRWKALGFSVG